MYKLLLKSRSHERPFFYIFSAALFLAFHYFFVTYINSTYLGNFLTDEFIGVVYTAGAIINIVMLLFLPRFIKRWGNYNIILILSIFEILFLNILAFATDPWAIIVTFMFHHGITALLLLCLDISIENFSIPKSIGKIRGAFLTTLSIAAVLSPMIVGAFMVDFGGFKQIYLFSSGFMVLFTLTVWRNFKKIPSGTYKEMNIKREVKEFLADRDLRLIGICNIILEFFYSWMIIYVPLYLAQEMGFSWRDIGLILSISLLPFLLLEIPIGELSDRKFLEREFLMLGFTITAISLFFFPLLTKASFGAWALLLILARIGASIVNTTVESYFFKKIQGRDELIGIFRMSTPISYIIGPLIGSITLYFLPFGQIFSVLGLIMIIGCITAIRLKTIR